MALTRTRHLTTGGFSLIEVLVALALLVIGVLAVTAGFTEGQRRLADADRRRAAVSFAHAKLDEKMALNYDTVATPQTPIEHLEGTTLVGEDEHEGLVRLWTVELDRPVRGMVRVWVGVRWTHRGVERVSPIVGWKAEGMPS